MLTVAGLSVTYPGGAPAVDGVSFTVGRGQNTALLGANGAGKTTLLLALVGVLPASGGEVYVDGVALSKKTMREVRSRVGMVFQNPDDQLFMNSIYEDAAFGPRSFGCSENETAARVDAALSRLGISGLSDRSPIRLSGGEKRLAAIATVLSMEPGYMLFDEPTAFLDPRSRRNLIKALSDLPQGKLFATHDLAFAEETCGRVLLLSHGRLVADGGPELLRDTPALEAAGL